MSNLRQEFCTRAELSLNFLVEFLLDSAWLGQKKLDLKELESEVSARELAWLIDIPRFMTFS